MTGIERIAIEAIVALFLVWGTVVYLEHRGAAECRAADAAAVTKQEARNAAQAADDAKTINIEAKTYHDTLSAPAPIDSPHISVCYYKAAAVPQAIPARSNPHAADPLRSPDPLPAVPGPDIGPELVRLGRIADALSTQRRDYIIRVCQ